MRARAEARARFLGLAAFVIRGRFLKMNMTGGLLALLEISTSIGNQNPEASL
jgi:hypothetical protein